MIGVCLSNFEATRIMGGSCGGKGEMGELDVKLALSVKRGGAE